MQPQTERQVKLQMIVFISVSWTYFSIKLTLLEFHIMFRAWKTVGAMELKLVIPNLVAALVAVNLLKLYLFLDKNIIFYLNQKSKTA